MSNVTLTLRDTTGNHTDYVLDYKIRETSLGNLWRDCLIENFFESGHPLEKTYCLHGWQTSWESTYPRNLNYLCERLNYYISVINNELPALGYPFIDLIFSVEGLKGNSQEQLLNKIHHHFEMLIGQSWDPSPWWLRDDISNKTRFSIRMLNNLCHEIEGIIHSIDSKRNKLGIFGSLNGVNQNGRYYEKNHVELSLENYNDFEDLIPFGSLRLYYAQLGKTHKEVYQDGDTDIERKNISGTRYVTGEWTSSFKKASREFKDPNYVNWLQENGWDINDPTLALKAGVVADLNTYDSENTIVNELLKRNDLYKINLDGREMLYNYTWADQEQWETLQY